MVPSLFFTEIRSIDQHTDFYRIPIRCTMGHMWTQFIAVEVHQKSMYLASVYTQLARNKWGMNGDYVRRATAVSKQTWKIKVIISFIDVSVFVYYRGNSPNLRWFEGALKRIANTYIFIVILRTMRRIRCLDSIAIDNDFSLSENAV